MKILAATILIMVFSFFASAQDNLEKRFQEAISSIRYNNIYNRIIWGFSPTNEYTVDQTEGTIRYQTENPHIHAIARIEVLGTFNLDDETFLWSDKNISIQKHLSAKVQQLRSSLPKEYQHDKFSSDTDFIQNLLALFSNELNANGFDIVRQENRIIYFALMKIAVCENDKPKYTIDVGPKFDFVKNEVLIKTIKQFHKEKVVINDKYYNLKTLTDDEAFKTITEVHLRYWKNEDEYYYPDLSWPCDYAENSTSDWKVLNLKGTRRLFVVYSTDLEWTIEHYAYEIDKDAKGKKIIIGHF